MSNKTIFKPENINPNMPYEFIYIFSIYRTLREGKNPYEATSYAWTDIQPIPENINRAYAVGLKDSISIGSFLIDNWQKVDKNRWMFSGKEYPSLLNKNWRIITRATGSWNWGQYLIVSLDGKGHASFIRPKTISKIINLN